MIKYCEENHFTSYNCIVPWMACLSQDQTQIQQFSRQVLVLTVSGRLSKCLLNQTTSMKCQCKQHAFLTKKVFESQISTPSPALAKKKTNKQQSPLNLHVSNIKTTTAYKPRVYTNLRGFQWAYKQTNIQRVLIAEIQNCFEKSYSYSCSLKWVSHSLVITFYNITK